MRSFFRKFKEGLKNQTPTFHKAFEKIFSGAKLDPESLEELEEILGVLVGIIWLYLLL